MPKSFRLAKNESEIFGEFNRRKDAKKIADLIKKLTSIKDPANHLMGDPSLLKDCARQLDDKINGPDWESIARLLKVNIKEVVIFIAYY